jgi:hypothetical protein
VEQVAKGVVPLPNLKVVWIDADGDGCQWLRHLRHCYDTPNLHSVYCYDVDSVGAGLGFGDVIQSVSGVMDMPFERG